MTSTGILIVAISLGVNNTGLNQPNSNPILSESLKNPVGDISGYYSCKGRDVNGKSYKGLAMIIKKNDIYVVQWTIGIGSSFVGIGIRNGDTLAISWAMNRDDKGIVRGVNLYKIYPGPRLAGYWATLPGPGVRQEETLTFIKSLEK